MADTVGNTGDTIGLLLAAGAGTRMGMPKALVIGDDNVPWVLSSARALIAGGCTRTVVVVGAAADDVRQLLVAEPVRIVEAPDWAHGMAHSLAAGLEALGLEAADVTGATGAHAALVHLVDLPDVGADVIERLRGYATPAVLARAAYGNGPGHPVLIGCEHWQRVIDETAGDQGARGYLAGHTVTEVDCSDLATGIDIDTPRPMLDS